MNHRERIHAALRGEPVDKVPVALWRHFPNDDLRAETLAARVVEFQSKYDFDLVKVTPASGYPAEMYGAAFIDGKNREGTRSYTSRPVNRLDDWDKLAPLDASNAVTVREAAAVKSIRAQLGDDVPILQTIFGPLNSAHNLAGERMFGDLRAHPDIVERALRAIAETTINFAVASLRAGATAIFYATQMATSRYVTEDEFHRYAEPYDMQVLQAIRAEKPDFVLLHIHGLDIYFNALTQWPVDILNWHDRRTAPTLSAARTLLGAQSGKALLGGLEEWKTLTEGSPENVLNQARDAVGATQGRGFILGAGCVIPVDTSEANIRAAIDAVRG